MNLKQCLILQILLVSISSTLAAPIPDGQWNGKPWEKAHLLAEVKKGNPDALAEWSYCSRNSFLKINHNAKLIYERAKQADKGGSIFGKRLHGKCLLLGEGVKVNVKEGIKLIELAAAQKHPEAYLDMAISYIYGLGRKKDIKMAKSYLDKAVGHNSIRLNNIMSLYHSIPNSPHSSHKEQAKYQSLAIMTDNQLYCANNLRITYVEFPNRPINKYISKKVFEKANELIQNAVSLNNPHALSSQGSYEYNHGDAHLGISLMMRAANLDNTNAHRVMSKWMIHGARNRQHQLIAIGTSADGALAAKIAYNRGIRTKGTRFAYARLLAQRTKNPSKEQLDLAESLYRGLIAESYIMAFSDLGQMLMNKHIYYGADRATFDRGESLLIYYSKLDPVSDHFLAAYFLQDPKFKSHNLVRGVAAATSSVKRNDGAWKKHSHQMLTAAQKQLTPEQKKAAQELIDKGYPNSDHFRKLAFKHLQQTGDIPKDWQYGQYRPKE